jgi:hypothetical protein
MIHPPREFKHPRWLLALLLTAHGLFVMDAIRKQSPTWDEIIVPAVGLAQWRTGEISINAAHPFLSKLLCSFPLLLTSARMPFDHASWREKDPSRFGFEFTFRGTSEPRKIIFWSRIPSLILSVGMCLIGFLWGRSVWGERGGFVCLICLSFSPILLSRASLALLEMPLYFFLALTLYLWTQWLRSARRTFYFLAAGTAGCAMACKSAAVPFLAALLLSEITRKSPRLFLRRMRDALGFFLLIILTVLLLYLPWKGGLSALKEAWIFPLQFGKTHNQFYFAGTLFQNAPAIFSWAALALKAPLFIWALALWGSIQWYRSGQERDLWWGLLWIVGVTLLSAFVAGTALSTVQLSPLYIALAAFASGIACTKWDSKKAALALLLFIGAGVDVANAHPNQLAFFNLLTGGPPHGHRWLADSDQDWGQSLPELARYLKREGDPHVILCYSGSADPEAYGIFYQDLLSPALVSRGRKNRLLPLEGQRVYLAISTKVLQVEPEALQWLTGSLSPKKMVDACFFIFDISMEAGIFQRMARIYRQTGRETEARWAEEKARKLEPGIMTQDSLRRTP